MKKKKSLQNLKSWWAAWLVGVTIIAGLVTWSSRLTAIAGAPEQIRKTQEEVEKLASQLQAYTASEEEANKQRDKLISLMAAKLMED